MRPHYDFSKGERGKYAGLYGESVVCDDCGWRDPGCVDNAIEMWRWTMANGKLRCSECSRKAGIPWPEGQEPYGSDAVKILHSLYVGDDPGRLAALEEERRLADKEQEEFDRTGVDPHEE